MAESKPPEGVTEAPAEAPAAEAPAAEAKKDAKPKQPKAPKGARLHVKNLGDEITSEALTALFAAHGTVKKGEVKTDKDGKSKGFGQIIMSTEEEGTKAIAALNGSKQGEKEINVILAPEPEKTEKKIDGKDKGKGKGKGKSKGAAAGYNTTYDPMASYQQMWNAMYSAPPEQIPNWMLDSSNWSQMDPQTAQIMQQQMLTWQYMSSMAMQPVAPAPAEQGKSKGKGAGKSKDKGTKVDGTFTGKLKSINFREDKGYGFIECAETHEKYGRDVYVGADVVPKGAKVGDQYEFNLILSKGGQIRAINVKSK